METLKDKIKELEKEEIIKALKECGWVMARAARKLGITERMITYKIAKYGIRTKEVRWVDQSGTQIGDRQKQSCAPQERTGSTEVGLETCQIFRSREEK